MPSTCLSSNSFLHNKVPLVRRLGAEFRGPERLHLRVIARENLHLGGAISDSVHLGACQAALPSDRFSPARRRDRPFTPPATPDYDGRVNRLDQTDQDQLLERFIRYARIETTSDRHVRDIPSTQSQWDLLKLLVKELMDLGLSDVELTKNGYLISRIPSNIEGKARPVIGLMAHIDTASDAPGDRVNPQIHRDYNGGVIEVGEGFRLDPAEFPELTRYKGGTIVTTDGRTLLGADDKAGVAEIMTAVAWIQGHPELKHGTLEIIFTPDEETGKGLDLFPVEKLTARCCYTVDGTVEGTVEAECFNAYQVHATFTGRVIHLGYARGRLVNAVSMAGAFLNMLPQAESPEATDGRFGYYCPVEVRGTLETATVDVFLRDFDEQEMKRRIGALHDMACAVEGIFPGGKVVLTETKQYSNMYQSIQRDPLAVDLALEAIKMAGCEARLELIRGGTDGSKLTEMGIPTPNLFSGAQNYHSRSEWVGFSTMVKATETILNLAELWGRQ